MRLRPEILIPATNDTGDTKDVLVRTRTRNAWPYFSSKVCSGGRSNISQAVPAALAAKIPSFDTGGPQCDQLKERKSKHPFAFSHSCVSNSPNIKASFSEVDTIHFFHFLELRRTQDANDRGGSPSSRRKCHRTHDPIWQNIRSISQEKNQLRQKTIPRETSRLHLRRHR